MGHTSEHRYAVGPDAGKPLETLHESWAAFTLYLHDDADFIVRWAPHSMPGHCILTIEGANHQRLGQLVMSHQIAADLWWALSSHTLQSPGEVDGHCS